MPHTFRLLARKPESYHLGCEVGRLISLERLIEQDKERYYETLERSSEGWHRGPGGAQWRRNGNV